MQNLSSAIGHTRLRNCENGFSSSHSAVINIKINVGNLNKLIFILENLSALNYGCDVLCGRKKEMQPVPKHRSLHPNSMQTNKIRRCGARYQTQTELKLTQFTWLALCAAHQSRENASIQHIVMVDCVPRVDAKSQKHEKKKQTF